MKREAEKRLTDLERAVALRGIEDRRTRGRENLAASAFRERSFEVLVAEGRRRVARRRLEWASYTR